MEWSPKSATNAFLDTLKLSKKQKESEYCEKEVESIEFISALAAGMSAQLMVEVTPQVSSSTVALAAAARQTGGKLVCILPADHHQILEQNEQMNETQQVLIDDISGLHDRVEFRTGDPIEALLNYKNIDFSLVDCKKNNDDCSMLLMLGQLGRVLNPRRSVVVANNLVEGMLLEGHLNNNRRSVVVDHESMMIKSVKHHPIGKGMEIITMTGRSISTATTTTTTTDHHHYGIGKRSGKRISEKKGGGISKMKSKWIVKTDENSGEEHIFRMFPK